MRVGTYLPQRSMDRAPVDVAREAEDLGYASLAVLDHLIPLGAPDGTPILESFSTLAAAAGVTSSIGLRTLVARAGLRPPVMTAHLVRTLAALAPGRFVLGLGSGDAASRREDALLGLPDLPMAGRREQVRATAAAVREWAPGVPVWIGGAGPSMRQLAAEIGDGWNVWAATPAEIETAAAGFGPPPAEEAGAPPHDRAARDRGGPGDWAPAGLGSRGILATWAGQVVLGDREWTPARPEDAERALRGGPEEVAAQLRALADAGVREAVVAFVGGGAAEQRREFARDVLPLL